MRYDAYQLTDERTNDRPGRRLQPDGRTRTDDAFSVCIGCGAPVTQDFARVFGDNDNVVHGCPSCMSAAEMQHGYTGEASRAP